MWVISPYYVRWTVFIFSKFSACVSELHKGFDIRGGHIILENPHYLLNWRKALLLQLGFCPSLSQFWLENMEEASLNECLSVALLWIPKARIFSHNGKQFLYPLPGTCYLPTMNWTVLLCLDINRRWTPGFDSIPSEKIFFGLPD